MPKVLCCLERQQSNTTGHLTMVVLRSCGVAVASSEGERIITYETSLKTLLTKWWCAFSVFLGNIKLAFERNPDLKSLLMDDFFRQAVGTCQESWRDVIATAAQYGVPVPAFSTALSFYDAYRCQRLPANLIQVNETFFYSLFL